MTVMFWIVVCINMGHIGKVKVKGHGTDVLLQTTSHEVKYMELVKRIVFFLQIIVCMP